jgi:deoxyribodipyrimidine photo-lyase
VGGASIWWIRRDLRLGDNRALATALARGQPVVPLFIRDPALLGRVHAGAEKRTAFLLGGLGTLARDLEARGAPLVVRSGPPEHVVPHLANEVGATLVVAEEEFSPYGRRRDAAVGRLVPLELVDGLTVHPPRRLTTATAGPYRVFTPFRRAWLGLGVPARRDLLPAPKDLPPLPCRLASEPLTTGPALTEFPPGEAEAHRRLAAFARGARAPIHAYAEARDRLDLPATSALSAYLRFGMLSARAAVVAACGAGADPTNPRARSGADVWLSELVWREFYQGILWHFPFVLRVAFEPRFRTIAWRDAADDLRAWQDGRTGYPVVDAAMRQLAATGWMHNRARMITASFLTKDLLIDWRHGEAWFMRQLVDGDPAANNGGWQWTAGTGTDAAPYFRIFNPVLQAKRFDPDGAYVRRWVPELARVPAAALHTPWELTPLEQQAAGCRIGRDYPAPIVDRRRARSRTLAAYGARLDRSRAED